MKAVASERMVLDASVAMAWCIEDEASSYTEYVLDKLLSGAEAITPGIWPLELANALLMAERRQRITAAQAAAALADIAALSIEIHPVDLERTFRVISVARQYDLTAYDAAYVELALQSGFPLASIDDKLKRAARRLGIHLLKA